MALRSGIAESLFVLLPLVVLAIVGFARGQTIVSVIRAPEVSFAAAVLMGQTVMKLIQLAGRASPDLLKHHNVALITAIVVVFGLVPALLVLGLILSTEKPQTFLVVLQAVFFSLGIAAFLAGSWLSGEIPTGESQHPSENDAN